MRETVTANSARWSFRSHAVLTSTRRNVRHTIVPPCADVDTPLDPGQPYSPGKGMAAGTFRLRWIWRRHSPGIHLKQLKRTVMRIPLYVRIRHQANKAATF